MKLHRHLFILLISAAFLNACSNGNATDDVTVIFQPKYATGFRVVKDGSDTLIQFLSHSDSHSDSPTVSHSVSLSEINPERLALLSTTHSYFVNALDGMKNVCGVTYSDRIQLENLQEQISNGRTQNLTRNGEVNLEELFMLNPTVLFSVPFEPHSIKRNYRIVLLSRPRNTLKNIRWGRLNGFVFLDMCFGRRRWHWHCLKALKRNI
jgi:ABC-type Fe3+-hydroxamate transport system substrate-binding protein